MDRLGCQARRLALLRDTVSQEALMRLSPQHHHRAYPWAEALAHPIKLFASTLPWSFFALFTLYPGFSKRLDDRGRFLLQAFHAWVWPSLIFWCVVPEHSPRQSFPLFPGIAGLQRSFLWPGFGARFPSAKSNLGRCSPVWLSPGWASRSSSSKLSCPSATRIGCRKPKANCWLV